MFSTLFTSDIPLPRRVWLAWSFLVFFIPFQLHYDYILNAFYHFGTGYPDAGLLAHLLWHNDWRLMVPSAFGNYSYLTIHFTPLFMIPAYLSYFFPTHMAEWHACFLATQYASLGLALFYAFSVLVKPGRQWQMLLLSAIAIGFSFNGSVMDGITYIHPEYLMPLAIFLFLLNYVRGRRLATFLFFIFALLQREDAGFHITAILGLIAVIRYAEHRSLRAVKREACFIAAAFTYSVLACALVYVLCNNYGFHSRSFHDVYTGTPPFAHLSWALLWDRAKIIFTDHIYIWAGFLLSIIWSIRTRNPYMIIGFAAYIPWLVLNYLALFDVAGQLGGYYAFPLVLSLAWPALAVLWRYGIPLPQEVAGKTILLQAAMVAIALLMWNNDVKHFEFGPDYDARWGSYRMQPGAENRAQVQDFVAQLDNSAGDLGIVMADSGTLSLISGRYNGQNVVNVVAQQPADTLVYMGGNPDWPATEVIAQAHKNHMASHYCMVVAPICLFTNRTAQQLGTLSSLMRERALPPEVVKQLQQ